MTKLEELFLEAYYKAATGSSAEDWFQAGLLAKQMYNESHGIGTPDYDKECEIKKKYFDKM